MTWFQILALLGCSCVFIAWLTVKFPNQMGGDHGGAAMLSGLLVVVAFMALVIAAVGWAFS